MAETSTATPSSTAPPWLAKKEWASGEIPSGWGATGCAFFWVATIGSGMAWLWLRGGASASSRIFAYAFAIPLTAPAFFLSLGSTLRTRKFGRSVFHLSTIPGVIGGNLTG